MGAEVTQSERDTIEGLRKLFEEDPEIKLAFAFYCWLHGWWEPESPDYFERAWKE